MNNINSIGRATPPINYGYTAAAPSFVYGSGNPLFDTGGKKGNIPTDYGYTAAAPSFVYGSGNPLFGADVGTNNGSFNGFSGTPFGQAGSSGSTSTIVNVNANWIANPQEVQDAVQNALQNANRAGNSTNYAGGIF